MLTGYVVDFEVMSKHDLGKVSERNFRKQRRVKRAVTEAVCEYNKGTVRTIVETQKALGVATGGSTKQLATILDCRKQKFRKRRQNARPGSKQDLSLNAIRPQLILFQPDIANHHCNLARQCTGVSGRWRRGWYERKFRTISRLRMVHGGLVYAGSTSDG
ncbi:hypothetical protein TNCV_4742771 [Trichonephila clavipes]|nr:hypothetical protein TNCV_4742771 [Trichonephila clavipes]